MMATLSIKNLPEDLYLKPKARAKRERRSVAQEVIGLLAVALALSIMDLKGLGAALWRAGLPTDRSIQ
jgi:plasmid stability protein